MRLFLGIFIISWSSIIVRWIGAVDPLLISFYRLFISALVLLPFIGKPAEFRVILNRKSIALVILAGFLLALHFYSWIASLQMTTVGNSIFLESTHPFWGWLLSVIFLKEKASYSFMAAFLIGLAGMYLTISNDLSGVGLPAGDLLAILAAFCVAGYLIIARILREQIPIYLYLFLVYGAAATVLIIIALIYNIRLFDFSVDSALLILLLALGPNLLGHSILNWASRRMAVYKVNMALLSEAVLATLYAALLLNEYPPASFYPGAFLILLSIFVVLKLSRK